MLGQLGKLMLVGAILLPIVGALIVLIGSWSREQRCRLAARLGWFSALLAVGSLISVAVSGPFIAVIVGDGKSPLIALWANQLSVTLLVLVTVVGALVQSFSLRYHQGDRMEARIFGYANVVVASMAVVSTSATVAVLVIAWVAAGAAFIKVVGSRPDLPGVIAASRRMLRMFILGDSALVVALAIIFVRVGNLDLAVPSQLVGLTHKLGDSAGVIAVLIVIAALTRSAQGPFGSWLLGTISAPTPTSALLHAGVVNGGGILLLRLAYLSGNSSIAISAMFILAVVNAVVGSALMVHKADVKGSLVYSTMAQMGFMIAECAVGAYLAAIIHLVGHAFYKAAMFFGSGSQIPTAGQLPSGPITVISIAYRTVATLVTTAVTIGVMTLVPGVLSHRGSVVLLLFVVSTVAIASWIWWSRAPLSIGWVFLWTVVLSLSGGLYAVLLGVFELWISPALPPVGFGVLSPWWLVVIVGGALVVLTLGKTRAFRRFLVPILIEIGTPSPDLTTKWTDIALQGGASGAPDLESQRLSPMWGESIR